MKSSSKTKWFVLSSFSLLLGVNQLLWLTFATIVISTKNHFNISEGKANLLTLIFPIIYVLISVPSGKILDQQGYKKVVSISAIIMLVGSIIRWIGVDFYWMVFAGQFLIALTQPFITNAINQITTDWFSENQINTATGLTIGGLFVGMAIGAFLSPVLINNFSFNQLLLVNVYVTLAITVFFLLTIKENDKSNLIKEAITMQSFTSLLKNKRLWIISFVVFIAIGYFNGLTNWLAPILALKEITEAQTGIITALIIIGGIFGAILIPMISDKLQKRQFFIFLSALSGVVLTYPILALATYNIALILGFLMGFVLLAGYPLLIASAEDVVHKNQSAQAVAILQLMGNLGGIIVVLLMEFVKNLTNTWFTAIYVLISVMFLGLIFIWQLKDVKK